MINLYQLKVSNTPLDNHYQLIDKIGGGGFSEVWLAEDLRSQVKVALKVYSSVQDMDSEGIKMFVLDGLIAVNRTEGGFLYKLTAAGRKYIGTLESDYKEQYLAIAETVHKKYARKSDSAILKEISGKAVQSLRR